MEGHELPVRDAADAARVVKALGAHRYVAGRLHLVHAFAFEAAGDDATLAEAKTWARAVLGSRDVDAASRDERLVRRSSEAEVAAVLDAFWGAERRRAHDALRGLLDRADLPVPDGEPFDEAVEEDVHPLLVDCGWELLTLAALDPERHRGAIASFGEPIAFEVARFEEESRVPKVTPLHELSAIGPVELLSAVGEDGALTRPLVLFAEGDPRYHDYVMRGVLRASKLSAPP